MKLKLCVNKNKLRVQTDLGFSFHFDSREQLEDHPIYDHMNGKDFKDCVKLLETISGCYYTEGVPFDSSLLKNVPNLIFDRSRGVVAIMLQDNIGTEPFVLFSVSELTTSNCLNDSVFSDLIKKIVVQYLQLNEEQPVSTTIFEQHKKAAYSSLLCSLQDINISS